jgi:hypothetical protein
VSGSEETVPKERRLPKWLKVILGLVAVLVLLLAELAREAYVLEVNRPAMGDQFTLNGKPSEGWVSATGQWFATAGSDKLVPNTVSIECRAEPRICVESSATLFRQFDGVGINTFIFEPSVMDDTTIVYSNPTHLCVDYVVRIDLQQRRVLATRTPKSGADPALCSPAGDRITMELGDPLADGNRDRSWQRDHFVPLVAMLEGMAD